MMRTNLSLSLRCAGCGEELEAVGDDKRQRVELPSAFAAEAVLMIKPCPTCFNRAAAPLRAIRAALGLPAEPKP